MTTRRMEDTMNEQTEMLRSLERMTSHLHVANRIPTRSHNHQGVSMSYPFRLRPLSDGTSIHVELDTAKQGRLDEIQSAIRDLEQKASALSVDVVEEVMVLAHGYDERIDGVRVERHLCDDGGSFMEVEFLLSDGLVLQLDDYRPGQTRT